MQHIVTGKRHVVQFRGDLACFSRPELKVERFSYPCPTPSAARGLLEAIYFKLEFSWQIEKIELLNEPAFITLRRNEVAGVASVANVKKWMKGTAKPTALVADDPSQRQQRQTVAVKEPKYRITAYIVPRKGQENNIGKFDKQMERRAKLGKVFQQPYFGCREFPAFFEYIEEGTKLEEPVKYSSDLGFMLYDVFDLRKTNNCYAAPFISMFKAKMVNGVLDVPPFDSPDVLKPERRAV